MPGQGSSWSLTFFDLFEGFSVQWEQQFNKFNTTGHANAIAQALLYKQCSP